MSGFHTVSSRIEMKALYELANILAPGGSSVMKRLAEMAIELCNAGSGGMPEKYSD
jgi:hypothetical protein